VRPFPCDTYGTACFDLAWSRERCGGFGDRDGRACERGAALRRDVAELVGTRVLRGHDRQDVAVARVVVVEVRALRRTGRRDGDVVVPVVGAGPRNLERTAGHDLVRP